MELHVNSLLQPMLGALEPARRRSRRGCLPKSGSCGRAVLPWLQPIVRGRCSPLCVAACSRRLES
eukprot:352767-Chlamydomonas_euryale.AAC.5